MNSRKQKYIIIGALCLAIVGLSISYALLSSNLKIGGIADVNADKWSVIFVKDEGTETPKGMASCSIGTIEDTSIKNLSATLKVPGDSCTFTVPVQNNGDIPAKLTNVINSEVELSFTGSGTDRVNDENILKNNVVYEVTYGETVINAATLYDDIDILEPGETETVTLRILFKSEATAIPKESVTVGGLDREFVFNNVISDIVQEDPIQCGDEQLIPTQITKPNKPELMEGMIPVYYDADENEWKKADVTNQDNSWYNYTNQQWANAVTVVEEGENTRSYYKDEAAVGTVIPMEDINTMWVWIPRYSYTIKSEDGKNYFGKKTSCNSNPTRQLPGEIDVKFISKSKDEKGTAQYTGGTASGYRTNEAFNFGGVKKSGIWVAKFEPTGKISSSCINTNCDVSGVTVKPGLTSIKVRVSSFFFMSRSMQLNNTNPYGFDADSGDLHMMKNDEWGAVAYLSQSRYGKYGNSDYTGANKEVYINNDGSYITGQSGGSRNASSTATKYAYNDMTNLGEGQGQAGPGASTTGNITGIYDMNGGADEYVMGVLEYDEQGVTTHNGQIVAGYSSGSNSGFKGLDKDGNKIESYYYEDLPDLPNEKYYNKYKSADPTTDTFLSAKADSACNGGVCYGHALSETFDASSGNHGWYNDYAYFVYRSYPWFNRGGDYNESTNAGIFNVEYKDGNSSSNVSCRLTFTP